MLNNHYKIIPFLLALVCVVYVLRLSEQPSTSFRPLNSQRTLETLDTPAAAGYDDDVVIGASIFNTVCKDYVYNQTFPESQKNYSKQITDRFHTWRGGNRLSQTIENMNPDSSVPASQNREKAAVAYAKSLTWYIVFLVLFLMTSFVCFWGFCCTCFNKCQKLCCFFHMANSPRGEYICGGVSLLLIVGLAGIGMFGHFTAKNVDNDMSSIICSLSYSLESIVQGDLKRHWLGLAPAGAKLGDTINYINALQTDSKTMNDTYLSIEASYATIETKILDTYNSHKGKTLPRVDTTKGTTYSPTFIENLGPPDSTSDTTTKKIMQETRLELTPFTNAASAMLSGLPVVLNQQNGLAPFVQSGKDTSTKAAEAIQGLLDLGETYSQQMDSGFTKAEKALKILFMVLAFIPVYCAIWWIINFLFKVKIIFFLNFGWYLLSVISIIGWIASIAFVPTSITLMESCGAMDQALTSAAFFNKSINLFLADPHHVNQYLYPCIFGNPDIPTAFGLAPPTKEYLSFYDQSLTHSATINQIAQSYPVLTQVPSAITEISQYKSGSKSDSPATTEDLSRLNTCSKSTSTCEPMQDTWYLASGSCPAAAGTVLSSTSESYKYAGSPSCWGLDMWRNGITKDIRVRYDAVKYMNDCQDTPKEANTNCTEALVPNFVTNRKGLDDLATQVTASLQTITNAYSDFKSKISTVASASKNVNTDLERITDTFNNVENGIMNNMKCSAIPEDIKILQNTICVGIIPTTFQLALTTMLFSLVSLFGALSLFCLARKLKRIEEDSEEIIEGKLGDDKKKGQKQQEFEMTATRVY